MARTSAAMQRLMDMDLPPPEFNLTPQQWRFVHAYVREPDNQGEAARQAGYSDKAAYSSATRLLKMEKIRNAIAAVSQDMAQSKRLTPDFVASRVTWALSQQPGEDGGPPWREWVSIAALAARITGLVQPGERTTNITMASNTLTVGGVDVSRLTMDQLVSMLPPSTPAEATPADFTVVKQDPEES